MYAFYSDGEVLIKAFLHGNDWWKLLDSCGNERWFLVCRADPIASLYRAFHDFLGKNNGFASANINFK